MSTSLYLYVGFLKFITIFSMFSEPNRGFLGFGTEFRTVRLLSKTVPNRPKLKYPFRTPLPGCCSSHVVHVTFSGLVLGELAYKDCRAAVLNLWVATPLGSNDDLPGVA
jgi:hypothetical protein